MTSDITATDDHEDRCKHYSGSHHKATVISAFTVQKFTHSG